MNLREEEDDDLSVYLSPRGRAPGIGEERGPSRAPKSGVVKLTSPHGSVRYLAFKNYRPISVLQVVTRDGIDAMIANVFTVRSERRKGWAAKLLRKARKDFRNVYHSSHLSDDGLTWKKRVG